MNIGDIYWGSSQHEFHPIVCLEVPHGKTMFAAAILSSHPHEQGNIINKQMEEIHFDRSNSAYTIYVDNTISKKQYLVKFKWLKDIPSLGTKIEGRLSSLGLQFVTEQLKDKLPQRVLQTLMDYDKHLTAQYLNNSNSISK